MYLFQRSVTTFVYGCSHIYIPLCIYFNTIASGTTTVPHNDLHSTMYLFQLNDNYMFYLRKGIYIPLCIYFNDYTLVYTNDKNLFTFHYVSISTVLIMDFAEADQYLHSTMYLFQPTRRGQPRLSCKYLHSTMYLFQLIT